MRCASGKGVRTGGALKRKRLSKFGKSLNDREEPRGEEMSREGGMGRANT